MPTAKLLELLSHPVALDAVRSLSQGNDPRGVLAGIAGDLIQARVAEALGMAPAAAAPRAQAKRAAPSRARARAHQVDDADVVDAEFTVINVTPRKGAKAG